MKLAIGTPKQPAKNIAMGFTLIEMILVMALFVVVFGIVAPDLSSFFRGRDLDSEAQRFLSLTRYGRSRAISEGVPVELWINAKQGVYGLQAVSGYTETEAKPLQDPVAKDVQISTSVPLQTLTQSNYWTQTKTVTRSLPTIRFQPDGHISDSSPKDIYFRQESGQQICIEEDLSHLRYAIQAIPTPRR